jgi:serine/threonine protein kinase
MLEVIDIMLQIAKAMRFLHNKEVAHHDLKCENILYKDGPWQLSSNLVVKLGDFGTAKTTVRNFTKNQNQTRMVGTLGYRAPELSGKNMLTSQRFPPMANVFSFGITFFEILIGEPPFSDLDDLQKRINEGERPKLPQTCPPMLEFLIQNCWDEKPQARPTFTQIYRMLLHANNLMLGMQPYEDLAFFFLTKA